MKKTNDEDLLSHREKMYLERVIKTPGNACWGWNGYKARNGYAKFKSKGKLISAHRLSWEMHFGEIPFGLIVGHHCDTPECTRVDHLYLGTHAHNSKDMVRKGRQAKGEANGGAKLNENQVLEIKKLIKFGVRVVDIAKEYGVHRTTIHRITNGTKWKHLEA